MPLGLVGAAELHDYSTLLATGETLCLFTDGLVEARRDGDMFDAERVSELLIEQTDKPLAEVAARLVGAVRSFHGDTLTDDLTLILIRPRRPCPH